MFNSNEGIVWLWYTGTQIAIQCTNYNDGNTLINCNQGQSRR